MTYEPLTRSVLLVLFRCFQSTVLGFMLLQNYVQHLTQNQNKIINTSKLSNRALIGSKSPLKTNQIKGNKIK